MRRLPLLVAVLAVMSLSLSACLPSSATVMGQDPGLEHPCNATIHGLSSTNFFEGGASTCQANGDMWTVGVEGETTATGGAGRSCTAGTGGPGMQSFPINVDPQWQESITGTGPYSVELAQIMSAGGDPCDSKTLGAYSWMGFFDHVENDSVVATDDGVTGMFGGAGNGGPLPSPQTAMEDVTVNYNTALIGGGDGATASVMYTGIWGGCVIFIEALFDGTGSPPPTDTATTTVWHDDSYPLVSSGCMDYVSIDLSSLFGVPGSYVPLKTSTDIDINWANIITYLQHTTCAPPSSGCEINNYPDTTGATVTSFDGVPDLPPYDAGAVTDSMGVSLQNYEPPGGGALPDQALVFSGLEFGSASPLPAGYGSM